MSYTTYTSEIFRSMALKCARGRYQKSLLEGSESWNGDTLRGRARDWLDKYRRSREALLVRLRKANLVVVVRGRAATVTGSRYHVVQEVLADETRTMAERVEVVLCLP